MALDREKTFLNAERLLKQGKAGPALDECRRLAEDAPKDLLMLNRIGDFLARSNRPADAIVYYEMIVADFAASGFYPKAIAILKKIIKVDPNYVAAVVRLGELNVRQKLPGEARTWFLQAAEAYLRSRDFGKAREVFAKLTQADPTNLAYVARLADAAAAAGDREGAGLEFAALGGRMLAAGKPEEAEKAYRRAAELLPDRVEPTAGLARCRAAAGDRDEALRLAEKAWATGGAPPGLADEIFSMLVQLGDTKLAATVLLDPRSDTLSDETVETAFKAAASRGDLDGTWARFEPMFDRAARAKQLDRLAQRFDRIARIEDGGDPRALEKLVEIRKGEGNRPAAARAVERLIRAYQAKGDAAKVAPALDVLKQLDPSSPLLFVGRTPGAAGPAGAPAASQAASAPEPPAAKSVFETPAVPVAPQDQEFVSGNMTEAEVFEKYGLRREALQQVRQITDRFPGHLPAQEKLVGFLRAQPDRGALKEGLVGLAMAKRALGDTEGARRAASEAAAMGVLEPEVRAFFERFSLLPREQPAAAPAPPPTPSPAASAPPSQSPPPLATPITRAEEEDLEVLFDDADGGESEAPLPGDDVLEEIRFYLDQGMMQDAATRIAQARAAGIDPQALDALAARVTAAPASVPAEGGGSEADEAEPSELLLDEADLSSITDALEAQFGPDAAEGADEPHAAPESEQSVDEVFGAFKEQVKAAVDAGDFRTHYDLGIAYKEMGLLDDAVAEFRVAAGTPELYREACSMLGLCHRERGELADAIRWYRSAIDAPGSDEAPLSGLRYDLAGTLEQSGDLQGAYDLFSRIVADEPGFRDVELRVARLKRLLDA